MMIRNILAILVFSTIQLQAQQLVLRGDYPDPSVVKIGDRYFATATTSNWGPVYPILESKDLVNWKTVAHAFTKLPGWADYYFWAPEISYDNGKVYLYYAAHKKGGNLCVGVASADKPEGPYTDHGPLICQEVGSIDAFPVRDENGKLYLIWKEDGNSVGKRTPIWIQELNEARTALLGEKKELFSNDQAWEGNLVEGVSIVQHQGYFYAFYAAAGCCGTGCTYLTGVARAKNLLGPWEKYSKNPVLDTDEKWKCPGHGTPVVKDGRFYFMYHAYNKASHVFTGREGLLIEYEITPDGWIVFKKTGGLGQDVPLQDARDKFRGKKMKHEWQWSVFQQPGYFKKGGELHLPSDNSSSGNFIGYKTTSGNYTATVRIHTKKSNALAGLSLVGDENNIITAFYQDDEVKIVEVKEGKEHVVATSKVSGAKNVYVRMVVSSGSAISYYFSKNGDSFELLHPSPINGAYLPPWDRAVRIGLTAKGIPGTKAVFDTFELDNR